MVAFQFASSGYTEVLLHTPLSNVLLYHVLFQKNDFDAVKALVVFDADVNCLNSSDLSPMDHAFIQQNAVSTFTYVLIRSPLTTGSYVMIY